MVSKAIANDFEIPLVEETGKSMQWFLQNFQECMNINPNLIRFDQDAALIVTIRELLSSIFFILDDWHLNQN